MARQALGVNLSAVRDTGLDRASQALINEAETAGADAGRTEARRPLHENALPSGLRAQVTLSTPDRWMSDRSGAARSILAGGI